MLIHTVIGSDNTPEKAINEAQDKYQAWLTSQDTICYQIYTLSAQTVHTGGEDGYFYHLITVTYEPLRPIGNSYENARRAQEVAKQ